MCGEEKNREKKEDKIWEEKMFLFMFLGKIKNERKENIKKIIFIYLFI